MLSEPLDSSLAGNYIPLSEPEFGGNEWKYVKECLDSGWVSSAGPFVNKFESRLASYVGSKYAVALVNGTAALHIALKIVGLEPGEEVLVSNLTFVAPVNAVLYCQCHPVLIDAHPETWQIDVDKIDRFLKEKCKMQGEQCINKDTGRRVRAILPVHILGLACDMDRIMELAQIYHLKVVEDAAEAMGVRYRGRHVGTFGDAGVFSFNGNKIITTGGGGMVVTDDSRGAEYGRYLANQAKNDQMEYVHNEVGYNYRLTNIQAALGVAQLELLDKFIQKKRTIAEAYEKAFSDLPVVTRMPSPPNCEPTYWLYTILLGQETSLQERKAFISILNEKGVGARPFWHTIHDLPPYRHCQASNIEHSRRLYERGVSLPCSVGLREDDLHRCIQVVQQSVRG